MEHVGAIFYNENSFVFREVPTLNERLGRKATIYHEVAHQWFGDLVTMRWFDDLWLKEGFSTYMAAKMQAALDPESDAWKSFYLRNKPLAYGVDMTAGTVPVWQELPNLDLAKSNYGPIVYNKAPAILKQLNFLVGEDAFRAGVQRFLRRYAYGNASWEELLREIEGDRPGSLAAFGEQYILRPGMPVIEPVLTEAGGRIGELTLVQRPVRTLEGDRGGWWPGRVQVRLGYRSRPDTVLTATFTGDTTRVQGAVGLPVPDYLFANEGDYGYGLFLLDPSSTRYMLAHVGEVRDPLLRAMVWGSLWDLVRESRLAPAEYVELALRELPRERDEQIGTQILARGSAALSRYVSAADANRLIPRWEQLLLARTEDPKLSYGIRKSSLDALIAVARTPEALSALRGYLAGTRRFDGKPVQQPTRDRPLAAGTRRPRGTQAFCRRAGPRHHSGSQARSVRCWCRCGERRHQGWVLRALPGRSRSERRMGHRQPGCIPPSGSYSAHSAPSSPIARSAGVDPRQSAHLLSATLAGGVHRQPAKCRGTGRGGSLPGGPARPAARPATQGAPGPG
jgi:aminopeptidase N